MTPMHRLRRSLEQCLSGGARPRHRSRSTDGMSCEQLEVRQLLTASADLQAYRPVTPFIDPTAHSVPEAVETDPQRGPGIRFNGDDDNHNNVADFLESATVPTGDNDLVQVDIAAVGDVFVLSWTGPLAVWNSPTKSTSVANGGIVTVGQTVWVECTSATGEQNPVMSLTANEISSKTQASDQVVFHLFRGEVVVIGGFSEDPADVGAPGLGLFNIGGQLYDLGYDVHLFAHDQVAADGAGAVYDEIVSAVLERRATDIAILGYSWGAGGTHDLSVALAANTDLTSAGYRLRYTASVDGIRHHLLFAETRLPVGSEFHDNYFQRKDPLLRGQRIAGAVNHNVSHKRWGRKLTHTQMDDAPQLQAGIVQTLAGRVSR